MAELNNEENLYPIAVLIDELRNEDVQVSFIAITILARLIIILQFCPPTTIGSAKLYSQTLYDCVSIGRGAHANRVDSLLGRHHLR